MRVIGIDPSLTRTAVVVMEPGCPPEAHSIEVKAKGGSLFNRATRLDQIANRVDIHLVNNLGDDCCVVIEGPSLGQARQSGTFDRAGLWWEIVKRCGDLGLGVPAEVPPTSLKKYATGKGNSGKDEVLLAVAKRYPDAPVSNNDEADAWVLAAMGMRALGQPVDDLPKAHLDAMKGVDWSAIGVSHEPR